MSHPSHLASQDSPLMGCCSEKSILTKQINDSMYLLLASEIICNIVQDKRTIMECISCREKKHIFEAFYSSDNSDLTKHSDLVEIQIHNGRVSLFMFVRNKIHFDLNKKKIPISQCLNQKSSSQSFCLWTCDCYKILEEKNC